MKAAIDKREPWVKMVKADNNGSSTMKVIRMVGTTRNPGGGSRSYLHIEGECDGKTVLLHLSGHKTLRTIAQMILDGTKPVSR